MSKRPMPSDEGPTREWLEKHDDEGNVSVGGLAHDMGMLMSSRDCSPDNASLEATLKLLDDAHRAQTAMPISIGKARELCESLLAARERAEKAEREQDFPELVEHNRKLKAERDGLAREVRIARRMRDKTDAMAVMAYDDARAANEAQGWGNEK